LRIKKLHDDLESRNRLLQKVLNRYVAEDVADTILTDPERYLQLGGEIRPVTVLFADIRGFTRYTEQHTGPQVVETLNRIFPVLSQVIFSHRGTFDKYFGDGLMAFYGAPVAGDDDTQRAIETAIEMQHMFHKLRQGTEFAALGLGVGLNSGEAVVGTIGSEKLMEYTVIGDTVNIAKRLQEHAETGQVILSRATYDQIKGIKAKRLKPLKVFGRQESVEAYLIQC
jgi:adenylate cyclase